MQSVAAEVRLYDPLFNEPNPGAGDDFINDLNLNSLKVREECRLEPALAGLSPGALVQFERQGYFCSDPNSTSERPVFNRTVGLRDTWSRIQAKS